MHNNVCSLNRDIHVGLLKQGLVDIYYIIVTVFFKLHYTPQVQAVQEKRVCEAVRFTPSFMG